MTAEKFYEVLSDINEKYVKESGITEKPKQSVLRRFGTAAACLAVIAVLGAGLLHIGLFGGRTDVADLDNGDKIAFVKSDTAGASLSLDMDVTTRQLTEEEVHTLFGDLPVTADAIFTAGDTPDDSEPALIGFEGNIGNVKIIISTSDVQLFDTVIEGDEKSSAVNNVNISAGYFITEPNSKNERTAIYYAEFELGSSRVYLENAGSADDSEIIKNELASVIQKLTDNGELSLTAFE